MNDPIDKPFLNAKIRSHGHTSGIQWATADAPIYGAINGYVRIPEDHPWHGLDYDDEEIEVGVNGGLTFSAYNGNSYWLGFDTLHSGDYWPEMRHFCDEPIGSCGCTKWTLSLVAEETRNLARQVAVAGQRTPREIHEKNTLNKVRETLVKVLGSEDQASYAIREMQNAGILFRERG